MGCDDKQDLQCRHIEESNRDYVRKIITCPTCGKSREADGIYRVCCGTTGHETPDDFRIINEYNDKRRQKKQKT